MSRILFALLCSIAINAQAIVMTPDQPSETTSSKHAAHITRTRSGNTPAKSAPLPPLSKATTGFCQTLNPYSPNYDMMELYLQQGADINATCPDGIPVLHMVAASNVDLAAWLIRHGADVNVTAADDQAKGITLVMRAAHSTQTGQGINPKLLDLLVQNGANVKTFDSMGRTPLHYLNHYQNLWPMQQDDVFANFLDKLIRGGVDVNHQDNSGKTALMDATNSCATFSVNLLLGYGANPALKNKIGKSALDFAMDRATQSGQNSPCNEVAKILSKAPQASRATSTSSYANTNQQGVARNVGTYGGTYNGADEGVFQADINQDGTATFNGHSNKIGMTYTHAGKVSSDGSVTFVSAIPGVEFTGSVSRDGVFSGAWKNSSTGESGNFQGKKDIQVAIPNSNLLQAFGSLFK